MIKVELNGKGNGVLFNDVPIHGFFVDQDDLLCIKITLSSYLFFDEIEAKIWHTYRGKKIKRIINDIEIKEL